MASDRVVRIILKGESGSVVRAFEVAGLAAEKTQGKFERMQAVGRGMTSVGRTMTSMAVPLVALGAYAAKSAISFQAAMERVRTQAGATQRQVGQLSRGVLGLAPGAGMNPNELASGMYHVTSSLNKTIAPAQRVSKELAVLRVAAQGAGVGGANLVDVTNALDGAIVSGMKGVRSYGQAMGALNSAVGAGDMSMQDMADAMGTGLTGPMRTYGVSLRSVTSALAVFGDNNMRGAEAGTKLASAIRIMAAPSTAATKALGSIGLGQTQLANDLRKPDGLVAALTDLHKHLQGLSKSDQGLVITRAFGGRQSTGVQLLLAQLGRLRATYAQVGAGARGFTADVAAYHKTWAYQWSHLKAVADTALIGVGKAIMPIVVKWLTTLAAAVSSVAHWFTHLSKPVRDVVVGLTLFLAVGGPILMFLGKTVTAIGTLGKALKGLRLITLITSNAMKASMIGLIVFALVEVITHFQTVKRITNDVFRIMGSVARAGARAVTDALREIGRVATWLFRNTPLGGMLHMMGGFMGAGWNLLHGNVSGAGQSLVGGARGLLHGMTFGLLHSGGPVKRRHFDTGGPVGMDTIPGWLSPGEYVLNRATTSRIGIPTLNALNAGAGLGGGGQVTVVPESPIVVNMDGRRVGQGVLRWTLQRAARGPSSLVGGGLMTGSATA